MQRSSLSIAALATALAKAQIELANPEKSLTGTIEPQGGEGSARQFRYAPLSSGLEIVRKTLGQHEIAMVQTTAIDQAAGIVCLTTVLAHSSGEWIASDWPICPVAETARPHRMGAALTYARRYALFSLVGIAGDDDLDAPDLLSSAALEIKPDSSSPTVNKKNTFKGGQRQATPSRPKLKPEASAALREQLTVELNHITSSDEAANWAHRVIADKNSLTAADAECVEQVFQARLAIITTEAAGGLSAQLEPSGRRPDRKKCRQVAVVDKSVLALPAPRRIRDREHVKSVAKQPCLVCGRRPADAHHLRFVQSPALGRKVSDEFTIPLCRGHHREVHRFGDEAAWWKTTGINPTVAARALWLKTHPLPGVISTAGSKVRKKPNVESSPS
jgi:ERF superfamily